MMLRRNLLSIVSAVLGVMVFAIIFAYPVLAVENEIEMSPAVIDLEGMPRDIIKREITITNISGNLLAVYPTVRNLTADGGIEPFTEMQTSEENKVASLANWVGLYRGRTTLEPFESATIPVTIHINSRAESGTYHAIIAFPSGNTRVEAEAKLNDVPQTIMTLRVGENIQESLSLLNFHGTYALSSSDPVTFTYELENGGNQSIKPNGDIILYDRRGNEIGAVPINAEELTIPPGESVALASIWNASGARKGRFKAFLDVRYGEANLKSVQDTTFLWVVPLPTLAIIFAILLLASTVFVILMQKRALVKHRVRIDDWHKESAEKHGSGGRKQRVSGFEESAMRTQRSPQETPPQIIQAKNGNILDLRRKIQDTRNKETDKKQ